MKQLAKGSLLLFAIGLFLAVVRAQPSVTPTKVLGTWHSLDKINGAAQVAITIKQEAGKLSGTAVLRGLSQGNDDNVTLDLRFAGARFDGKVLAFTLEFPGPEKPVADWELTLTKDNEASFKVVRDNDGPVADGPSFAMKRTKAD